MLRAAILRNLRPTTLLLGKQPHSKWNKLDRLLVHAYQIHEDEISSNTGLPVWVTRSLDPNIRIAVEERTDMADYALAKWDKENAGKDKKMGVSRFAVALDIEGKPLEYGGLTRQGFTEAAIQEQQDRDEELSEAGIERDRPEGGYNPADYGDGLTSPA
ncbi:MAG: hypothetical protein K0S70_115 [Microbacterium sp.]|jgi:hypothetical protein|nr:hypothetical protein [Microbacterium sp.]